MLHGMPELGPLLASGRDADVFAYGRDLVVRRSRHGRSMEREAKRPWTFHRNAARLATLHHRLHEIPAPDWPERMFGGGDRGIHLDLHPLNVILSPQGPRPIDWTNAACGAGSADLALTGPPMATPGPPASPLRRT